MKTTLTKRTQTEAHLTITLSADYMAPHVAHIYDGLRSRVKADGFRPGKAPDHIVERQLGSSMVHSEVIDDLLQYSYASAVREHQLPVISSPKVEITKFVPYTEMEYTAVAELMPPVTLPDYKKIKARRGKVQLTDADVDQVVEDLRRRSAGRVAVDRAATTDDELDFDFTGTRDGEPVAGATSKHYKLVLGSGSFIPGFEDQLSGLKASEVKTFTITFPQDYHEKTLAGKPVQFEVLVHAVSEARLAPVDDAFAMEVAKVDTVKQLREDIETALRQERTEESEKQYENEVLEELLSKAKYTVPERLLAQQIERLKGELVQNLGSSGLDLERYAGATGKTVAQIEDELKPAAQKRVGLAMLLTEIAKAEAIQVTTEDIDQELDRLRASYKDPELLGELDKPETREDVYNHLMSLRTIEKVISYSETT
jgi:trigger factor